MVVVVLIQWFLMVAAGLIGLGVLGLVANSVAHAQACRLHAAALASAAGARSVAPAVEPELAAEEDDELPEWVAEPAPEAPDAIELPGVMGLLHEAPDGVRGVITTEQGQMPVLLPRHLLRIPDEGEQITVRGAVRGQVLHVAGWAPAA